MSGNWIFEGIKPKDEKKIIDSILPVTKDKGDVILKQGEEGDNFYILEKGTLSCMQYLEDTDSEQAFLAEYKPGESFGQVALLSKQPNTYSIICTSENAELWCIDYNAFTHLLKAAVEKNMNKYSKQ